MRQIDTSTGVPGRVPSRGGEPEELSESELRERGVLFDVLRSSDSRGGEAFDMQTAKALGQVPPVGTWRMDPVLGYLEQLQLVPVDELSFSESTTDPIIRRSVDKYVGYYQEGLQPPPADVVWNEPTQRLMTLNRRRVLAAKEAGVPSILAWVGGDTYENMKERAMRRRNPAELLLLNPAASRPLSMVEVQQVMVDLAVPKEWRTRFMQGLNVEWSEHGGGIDAHSVGALVVDHLNEDPNYYRRAARSNPHAAPPFVKKNLDNMLDRTGKTEDILTSLADIYAERAQAPQYAHSVEQMHQTEHALRSAAQSVEDVWTPVATRANPAVRIPKGMRPVIEAYGEQIAKLASRVVHEVTGEPLDVQWTPRTEPLGAGSWGVVYPTHDPRFVVKVTADPTEGPIVSTIMSEPQLHDHMGIIHYFALRKLPEDVVFRGKTFPVFVIIAERLKDVGGLRRYNTSREDQHLTRLLMKIKDVAGKLVHEKQKKRPSQRLLDDLDEQYLELVGQINDGPLSDFFFQFRDATETGVLADVHLGNLGKRAVDWESITNGAVPLAESDSYWVISDPGHSSVETHPDITLLRENPRRRANPSPMPEGFTTSFGIDVPDDYVAPPLPESRRVLRDLQSDDIVTVGRTQWVISRSAGDSQAYAYKYPSKRTKLYVIEGTGPNTPDTVIVYEVGGSGQRISEDVAMGPLRLGAR